MALEAKSWRALISMQSTSKTHAGLGVNAFAANEIGVFRGVDPVRISSEEPWIGPGRRDQARLFDRFQTPGESVDACHRIRRGGGDVLSCIHRPGAAWGIR